jgi:hypothetical protein
MSCHVLVLLLLRARWLCCSAVVCAAVAVVGCVHWLGLFMLLQPLLWWLWCLHGRLCLMQQVHYG